MKSSTVSVVGTKVNDKVNKLLALSYFAVAVCILMLIIITIVCLWLLEVTTAVILTLLLMNIY